MIRAKMKVQSITDFGYSKSVKLTCQYDEGTPEDQRFQKATPSGEASFTIDNPAALEQFVIGKMFYVDFIEIVAG